MENLGAQTPEIDIFDELNIINNRKRISEELFVKLRDAIISGKLPGGYVFPNENEMCKRLDIGRSTLREAYAPLETMNLITRTKNGTFVSQEADAKNPMNFDKVAQYTDPVNIIEYRKILEVGIAASAAERAGPADVRALSRIVDQMEENDSDPKALTILDFEFHHKLARITGNELLTIALSSVRTSYEQFVFEVFKKDLFTQSVIDHRNIIKAVRASDPQLAAQLMREHLSHIEQVALFRLAANEGRSRS